MYHLTIINPDGIECSKRIYRELHHAISDVFTSSVNEFVDVGDTTKPKSLRTGGTMANGYDDEFYFDYDNGYSICIGKLYIEDDDEEYYKEHK